MRVKGGGGKRKRKENKIRELVEMEKKKKNSPDLRKQKIFTYLHIKKRKKHRNYT